MTGEDSTTPTTDRSGRGVRLVAALAVIAAIIGGGIWLWEVVLEYKFIPKRFGVVEAGAIYRSGQLSPEMIGKTLRKHAIEIVVSLRPGAATRTGLGSSDLARTCRALHLSPQPRLDRVRLSHVRAAH